MSVATSFDKLYALIKTLRGPEGCPWDREQTVESALQDTQNELYECMDEIFAKDPKGTAEELGDVYLTLTTLATLLYERDGIALEDALDGVHDKLIRRHPHIFGPDKGKTELTAEEVLTIWNKEKAKEKAQGLSSKGQTDHPLLAKSQKSAPPSEQSYAISKAMRKDGYTWAHIGEALAMVERECAEARACLDSLGDLPADKLEAFIEEIGDVYFSLANVLTFTGIQPTRVQRQVNNKIMARYSLMRELMQADGLDWEADEDKREDYWSKAKRAIRSSVRAL